MQRFIIIFFLLFACQTEPQKGSNYNTLQKQGNSASQTKRQTQSKAANSHQFEITTLQSASGWGYQISQNGIEGLVKFLQDRNKQLAAAKPSN